MRRQVGKQWARWAMAYGTIAVAIHSVAFMRFGGTASAPTFGEALRQAVLALTITISIHLIASIVSFVGIVTSILAIRNGERSRLLQLSWILNAPSVCIGLYFATQLLIEWLVGSA